MIIGASMIASFLGGCFTDLIKKGVSAVIDKAKSDSKAQHEYLVIRDKLAVVIRDPKKNKSFEQKLDEVVNSRFDAFIHGEDKRDGLNNLIEGVSEVLEQYRVPKDVRNVVSKQVVESSLQSLKKLYPLEYGIFVEEENNQIVKATNAVALENNKILKFLSERYQDYECNIEFEIKLQQSVNAPHLTLDYFEVDDKDFRKRFLNALSTKSSIYINYFDPNEALGCILKTLQFFQLGKKILIVNNIESWKALDGQIKEFILIANFISEDIPYLANNICIYIKDSGDQNSISLPRRRYQTIYNKLIACGFSEDKASELMQKTNGYYFLIHHELYRGSEEIYSAYKDYRKEISLFLKYPTWKDTDEDFSFIESQYSGNAQDLRSLIDTVFCNGKNPLLQRKTDTFSKEYRVLGLENVWLKFSSYIPETDYRKYLNSVSKDILDSYHGKGCSETILTGCLKSINFSVNMPNRNSVYQSYGDSFVRGLLDSIDKEHLGDLLDDYSTTLAEISPSSFVDFLEENKKWLFENKDKRQKIR